MRQWVELLPKELIDERDSEGFTALHYAARFNKFDIIQLLLDNDAGKQYCIMQHDMGFKASLALF